VRPDELAAREQIRQTISSYAHAVDRGRFDEAAACFASDGVLDVRGGDRSEGRDAIAARFAAAGQKLAAASEKAIIRHHVSSIAIEADVTAGTARSSSYFFAVTEIGPDHWGTYRDTFRRDDTTGRWLFTERQVTVDGRTGPSRMT
jgi:ketosteroid isomerase-like protein